MDLEDKDQLETNKLIVDDNDDYQNYSKAALSWAETIYYKYIVLAQLNAAVL